MFLNIGRSQCRKQILEQRSYTMLNKEFLLDFLSHHQWGLEIITPLYMKKFLVK